MMKPTRIDARGMSRDGVAVLAYLKETEFQLEATGPVIDYYTADQTPSAVVRQTSRWLGRGARLLGLDGRVESEALDSLAHGFDPVTGDALSQTAGRPAQWVPKLDASGQPMLNRQGLPKGTWRGGHRVGFDCTFSIAPKSVSLAFAAGTPEERVAILDAMRDAIAQTFAVMEANAETGRDHGGARKIGVHGLVASGFTHFSSRELEPQLHEHVLVYAVGNGVDGQWGGYEALSFFEHQEMYGALARAAFAKNLVALGYGVVKKVGVDVFGKPTGEVFFELAGVSDGTCEKFSARRKQILAHVEKHGTTKQQAAMATRKQKEEPSFEEVDQLWQRALERARCDDPTMFKRAADLKGLESQLAPISDHGVLDRLQAKDTVWTKQQLIAQLAREQVGLKDVSEILKEADAFLERMAPHLVRINPERPPETLHSGWRTGKKFEEPRYCSRDWFVEVEAQMIARSRQRVNEPHQAVSKTALAQAIEAFQTKRGFTLSAEQKRTVEHVTGAAGVVVLTGRAGTGKTTVADVYTRAFRAEGREVIGVSLSWNAALKLGEETGLNRVYSAAKLLSELDHGRLVLSDRHVIILDEAGMADTLTVSRILTHAAKAKVVLQGDARQLSPVTAGQAFRLLRDALGDVELTEIRRQKVAADVETSEAFYAHAGAQRGTVSQEAQRVLGADILARLEARNQIERTDTRQEAIEQLVEDYFESPLDHSDKLIMGSTNSDVAELNKAIRQRLVKGGAVSFQEHYVRLKQGKRRMELSLAAGDLIRFGRLNEDMGVTNGSVGTIEGIRATVKGSVMLRVRLDGSGRLVRLDTATYGDLDHAYARTVDKAQGATVTASFFLASAQRMDVHLGLVAATRHREHFKLYATETDLEIIEERLGVERLRVNALEEGRFAEPPSPNITLTT